MLKERWVRNAPAWMWVAPKWTFSVDGAAYQNRGYSFTASNNSYSTRNIITSYYLLILLDGLP